MCFSENNLLTNIFTYLGLEGILKSGKETIPVRLLPCTVSTSDPSGSFRETRETAHLSCSFVVLKDYLGPGNFLKKGDLACPTVPEARAARRRHCGEGVCPASTPHGKAEQQASTYEDCVPFSLQESFFP